MLEPVRLFKTLALVGLLMGGRSVAATPLPPEPHAAALRAAAQEPLPLPRAPGGGVAPDATHRLKSANLSHVVYGYLPYWEFDYENWHAESLSHVVFFSVGITPEGLVDTTRGYCDAFCQQLVAWAHDGGLRLHLAVTLMDDDGIATLCNTPEYVAQALATIRELVLEGAVDGVNVDFERVPRAARTSFTAFVAQLRTVLADIDPSLEVTVATPKVDWWDSYDYAGLAAVSDGLLVMSYGYRQGSSAPGPTAPLLAGSLWPWYTVRWTVDDYLERVAPADREKIWLGLGFYGIDWPVEAPRVPATARDDGVVKTYRAAAAEVDACGGWLFDAQSQSSYYHCRRGGVWHQVWLDNADSLALKLDLTLQSGLGGVGIWALGYEGTTAEFWTLIAERFRPTTTENRSPVAHAGPDREARVGEPVALDGSRSSDPDGDALNFQWLQTGGPTAVSLVGAAGPTPWFVAPLAGTYDFWLIVDDGAARSLPDDVHVTVLPVAADPDPDPDPDVADAVTPDAASGDGHAADAVAPDASADAPPPLPDAAEAEPGGDAAPPDATADDALAFDTSDATAAADLRPPDAPDAATAADGQPGDARAEGGADGSATPSDATADAESRAADDATAAPDAPAVNIDVAGPAAARSAGSGCAAGASAAAAWPALLAWVLFGAMRRRCCRSPSAP